MASTTKPNHVCKNKNCTKGPDGGPMHYYQCNACIRREGQASLWKMYCCSLECYKEFVAQVEEKKEERDKAALEAEAALQNAVKPEGIVLPKVETQEEKKVAAPEVKAEAKVEVKPEVKPEAKVEVKAEAKPEVKTEVKPQTQNNNNQKKDKDWYKK